MTAVSTNYRQLDASEVEAVAKECAEAWKHPEIPMRQYELCVKGELERWKRGESIAPFDALVRCWPHMNWAPSYHPTLLDVGASSGYYREVLKARDIPVDYTGCDSSGFFALLASNLYPDVPFDVADACNLPYANDEFDIVLSSAVIMHIYDYEKAIAEAARVARRYVIFNRTPIHTEGPTLFFQKEAYGIPVLEARFNEAELLMMFRKHGLRLEDYETVFWNTAERTGHRCYLLENISLAHYPA